MTQTLMEQPDAAAIEQALVGGDLSKLTAAQRISYYNQVCRSLGLNPLTKPFEYITLNGKLTLYARKDCTDQLRKIHRVSIEKPDIQFQDDWIVVTVLARDDQGRTDADTGVVNKKDMRGDYGNALMKAVTKAKRRVTLSMCGLGMLDETEVETIPSAMVVDAPAPELPAAAEPVGVPPGTFLIQRVEDSKFGKGRIHLHQSRTGQPGDDTSFLIYKDQLRSLAEELCQAGAPVFVEFKQSAAGKWRIENLSRVPADYNPYEDAPEPPAPVAADDIDDSQIPF